MRRILRVLLGFSLACLAATITALLFAITPAELFALGGDAAIDRIVWIAEMGWKLAVVLAMMAGLPAALAIARGERRSIRSARSYVLVGVGIALIGYVAQAGMTLISMPLVIVGYSALAYTSAGAIAGMVYWAIAGRLAGDEPEEQAPVKTVWLARAARDRRGLRLP